MADVFKILIKIVFFLPFIFIVFGNFKLVISMFAFCYATLITILVFVCKLDYLILIFSFVFILIGIWNIIFND